MYFEDLSDYAYGRGSFYRPKTKNIGWLEGCHSYQQAPASEHMLEVLWQYCSISVAQTRGIHECDLCSDLDSYVASRNGKKLLLGSSEIRVFGADGIIYAAPTLIYHYVSVHQYSPPDEFVQALNSALGPPNQAYFDRLCELDFEWRETSAPSGPAFKFTADGRKVIISRNR